MLLKAQSADSLAGLLSVLIGVEMTGNKTHARIAATHAATALTQAATALKNAIIAIILNCLDALLLALVAIS